MSSAPDTNSPTPPQGGIPKCPECGGYHGDVCGACGTSLHPPHGEHLCKPDPEFMAKYAQGEIEPHNQGEIEQQIRNMTINAAGDGLSPQNVTFLLTLITVQVQAAEARARRELIRIIDADDVDAAYVVRVDRLRNALHEALAALKEPSHE